MESNWKGDSLRNNLLIFQSYRFVWREANNANNLQLQEDELSLIRTLFPL